MVTSSSDSSIYIWVVLGEMQPKVVCCFTSTVIEYTSMKRATSTSTKYDVLANTGSSYKVKLWKLFKMRNKYDVVWM